MVKEELKNLREWAAVQELHKRKVPILRIAKQLKMSRNTVKKLIRLKEEPKYTSVTGIIKGRDSGKQKRRIFSNLIQ